MGSQLPTVATIERLAFVAGPQVVVEMTQEALEGYLRSLGIMPSRDICSWPSGTFAAGKR